MAARLTASLSSWARRAACLFPCCPPYPSLILATSSPWRQALDEYEEEQERSQSQLARQQAKAAKHQAALQKKATAKGKKKKVGQGRHASCTLLPICSFADSSPQGRVHCSAAPGERQPPMHLAHCRPSASPLQGHEWSDDEDELSDSDDAFEGEEMAVAQGAHLVVAQGQLGW